MRLLEFLFNFVRFAWNLFWVGLIIIGSISIIFALYHDDRPRHPPYTITTNTLKLTEFWRVSNLSVWAEPPTRSTSIGVTPYCIIVVSWDGLLVCLSPENGEVKWETIVKPMTVLAHDLNTVYTGASADYIKAYSLKTGNLIWTSEVYLLDRSSNFLNLSNNMLFSYVVKNDKEYIYQINPTTGELVTQKIALIPNDDFPSFIMQLNGTDLRQNLDYLVKVNHQTGATLWQTKLNHLASQYKNFNKVKNFPILTHNT